MEKPWLKIKLFRNKVNNFQFLFMEYKNIPKFFPGAMKRYYLENIKVKALWRIKSIYPYTYFF